jgi:hypothetical protein
MTDMLIRDIPDEVIAGLDAHAGRLGLSRSEYVRADWPRTRPGPALPSASRTWPGSPRRSLTWPTQMPCRRPGGEPLAD